jgi:hypothetical protein
VAKQYARKIEVRTWLADESKPLAERIEIALAEFDDPEGQPSVYVADTEEELTNSLAAQAWYRRDRDIEKIENTRYVMVAQGQLARAGLQLVPQQSTIPWQCLEGKHFVITVDGNPCSANDLRALVRILIEDRAPHGQKGKAELKEATRRELETESRDGY